MINIRVSKAFVKDVIKVTAASMALQAAVYGGINGADYLVHKKSRDNSEFNIALQRYKKAEKELSRYMKSRRKAVGYDYDFSKDELWKKKVENRDNTSEDLYNVIVALEALYGKSWFKYHSRFNDRS